MLPRPTVGSICLCLIRSNHCEHDLRSPAAKERWLDEGQVYEFLMAVGVVGWTGYFESGFALLKLLRSRWGISRCTGMRSQWLRMYRMKAARPDSP